MITLHSIEVARDSSRPAIKVVVHEEYGDTTGVFPVYLYLTSGPIGVSASVQELHRDWAVLMLVDQVSRGDCREIEGIMLGGAMFNPNFSGTDWAWQRSEAVDTPLLTIDDVTEAVKHYVDKRYESAKKRLTGVDHE